MLLSCICFHSWFQNEIFLVFCELNFNQFILSYVSFLNKLLQVYNHRSPLHCAEGFTMVSISKRQKLDFFFGSNLTTQELSCGLWWQFCLCTAAKASKINGFDPFNFTNSSSTHTKVSAVWHDQSNGMEMRKRGHLALCWCCQTQYSKLSRPEVAVW